MALARLELTPAQVRAIGGALDYALSDQETALMIFGTPAGIAAARRATEKVTDAGNAPGVNAWR